MITPVAASSIPPIEPVSAGGSASAPSTDFRTVLSSAIGQVESANASANAAVQGFLSGENQELHSTILATERSELEFNVFMQVRNKVVSAYQEIMRMQV